MAGAPRLGREIFNRSASLSSRAEELTHAPGAELLGTISPEALTNEPLPPWEVDARYDKHDTDARRFVSVPDNWELRWLSPAVVQREGMRDWQAVPGRGSSLVKVHNEAMIAPDNTVRKGGDRGDFLAWMYRSWVESRNRRKAEKIARRTGEARDRQEAVREQINRGSFGPYVHVDSVNHPSHTHGEGRTMTD